MKTTHIVAMVLWLTLGFMYGQDYIRAYKEKQKYSNLTGNIEWIYYQGKTKKCMLSVKENEERQHVINTGKDGKEHCQYLIRIANAEACCQLESAISRILSKTSGYITIKASISAREKMCKDISCIILDDDKIVRFDRNKPYIEINGIIDNTANPKNIKINTRSYP